MFTHISNPQLVDLKVKEQGGQRWYQIPSGEWFPSITTVLSIKEKPWLANWKNMLGNQAQKETDRCAERGTAVHKMAEHYLNNNAAPMKGFDLEHIKLFNQLKFHLNKLNNIRAQEVPLYSTDLRVAGRADCIAEYNGVLSIVDFKTSNNNKTKETIEDYFIQCTGYAIMYNELYQEPIENIVILMAVERGMVPLVFQEPIDAYVRPLIERINIFYEQHQQPTSK
jgi:genome maintenance exonuclease 1